MQTNFLIPTRKVWCFLASYKDGTYLAASIPSDELLFAETHARLLADDPIWTKPRLRLMHIPTDRYVRYNRGLYMWFHSDES